MAATRDPELRARLAGLTLRDEERLARRARHGGDPARLEAEIARAEQRIARRRAAVPAITYPPQLPVSERKDEILAAIRDHQVVVVAGETGSGKTTQLPKIALELGRGVRGGIAHTQPRRLAARTVAERIADELDVPLGEAVGYAVRFNDRSSENTLVRLMTDGLLLAEIQRDRLLRRYDTIIVDEAHERSLNIDFLLGCIKRMLPQRPELKLIVTSATIDPQRFSEYFGAAPIVEVSGRTYPVDVRYREPAGEDDDQADAIAHAVEELQREGPGDVLVFLSGEREIRDTADVLRGRLRPGVELLPLYARLASGEQQRVFQQRGPHPPRRVVLATNVAETSLTVPGIRYVVDPGTARISRYSARLKVQRLPIEPISQASADQRKGRCGRLSDGICIRLYSEEDFAERPRYTDPEILRTSLASVILQMAALGLGDIERFPFLDPPDRRQVRDGIALLQELRALDADQKLTRLGRDLAQLPVDPRLGRMVIEAGELDCANEVVVIAAGLSIQDPRERPAEQQAHADQLHARFADPDSDFLSLMAVYRYARELQRDLSSNQFRKRLKSEYLHHLRMREWQDLVGQLRQAAKQIGIKLNHEPAESETIHRALLSGLLSHIGLRDAARREYAGARGARFAIFPGSVLAKRQPSWTMVAELVETSRLWGRTAAKIDPRWVEPLAGHLVKRTYEEPRWDRKRASVVATERVTLYGLPIVAGRTVAYGRIDAEVSRDVFIRRGLVEGEWDTRHRFFAANREQLEQVEALEHRARRRDILVDDQVLYDFYAARIPETVVSGAHFDRWWKDARRAQPDLLDFTPELLVRGDAEEALSGRPVTWKQGELELPLTYHFEPGASHDGVTVHVPLHVLPQLRPEGFDWLVPAFRLELVTTLIRSLPKDVRRRLVPVPETAERVVAGLRPRRGRLLDAVAAAVGAPPADFDVSRLPAHLQMRFAVEDADGTELAAGHDLAALKAKLTPRLREALSSSTRGLERSGLRAWTIGELPHEVTLPETGDTVRAYPALVDEGDTVAVRMLESPGAQRAAMAAGTRRLLLLTLPSPVPSVAGKLSSDAKLALYGASLGGVQAVFDDCAAAAVDALVAEAGGPAWDEAGFAKLRAHVAGRLNAETLEVVTAAVRILDAEREVRRRADAITAIPLQESRADALAQVGRLVRPGFVAATGVARLADVERYVRAAALRLERLPAAPAVDRDRMKAVGELERAYRLRLQDWPRGRPVPDGLREVPWMLEELRVSHFAQGLGTRGAVSSKRIRQALAG
ncbi:ATP-dependent RNA helicase HrpA [Candidatus Solirubrobacter pratensis]|uniref:ATP-dependent RNA helicase HrpA n=1 Tax=Candidatus Solirubrobacter pratensis TaxID=1298857 RepID=UPI00040C6E56|nr:ATP-dependent RNA helicase HrpA [Candidatus Solirubrobacter pratensis]